MNVKYLTIFTSLVIRRAPGPCKTDFKYFHLLEKVALKNNVTPSQNFSVMAFSFQL